MINTDILKSIYLFKELSAAELENLKSACEEKTYTSGQDIFSAGQAAQCFYLIRMGSVKIAATTKSGEEIQIKQLGNGSHFGEMPFWISKNDLPLRKV